jgi:hypothetical protein
LTIQGVNLQNPSNLTLLYVPYAYATPDPGFPTELQLSADVTSTGGNGTNQGVTWSSSDSTLAQVSYLGKVSVVPQSTEPYREGFVTITATSIDDPTKSTSITLEIKCQGDLEVQIQSLRRMMLKRR